MQNSVLVILSDLFGFAQPPWVMSAMETKWQLTQSEETMAAKSEDHMAAGQVLRPKGSWLNLKTTGQLARSEDQKAAD